MSTTKSSIVQRNEVNGRSSVILSAAKNPASVAIHARSFATFRMTVVCASWRGARWRRAARRRTKSRAQGESAPARAYSAGAAPANEDTFPLPSDWRAPATDPGPRAPTKADAGPLPWLGSLGEGYRRATADRKPLLIRVGAKWCGPCRQLSADLQAPAVQAELARWTRVYFDVDDQRHDAEQLGVVAVPALRIRTPGGQPVAEQDGYSGPQQLVSWLKAHYDDATATADDTLLGTGEPDDTAVQRLVKQFQQRNPALREAAIRRLSAWPDVSRDAVVQAFSQGTLTARLASLDVLEQWKAPVEGLDPWQPESFTPERLARLEKWKHGKVAAAAAPTVLTAAGLTAAGRQIERMLAADEAEATAIRHRLAPLGQALLPEVYQRLKDAATDQDRRRLLTLRYRLVAGDALVLRWPGGLERLADSDPRVRQKAVEELSQRAGAAEEGREGWQFRDARRE